MDFDQIREVFNGNYFQNDITFLTNFNFALRFKTLYRAPQSIKNKGTHLLGMLPGAEYFRSKESQDVGGGGAIRCWSFEEVNECHRELGIVHGYRSDNCSVLQALLSLFRITNETTNFWTHFLPFAYFAWLFYSLSSAMSLFSDEFLLPFVCYMFTSCAYPLMSCLAHAFSCLSITATHVCFFMDYATLSVYSWGAAILYYNYVIPQSMLYSFYAASFLPIAAFLATVATFMACSSRFVSAKSISCKLLRLGAFVIPYLWVSAPLAWRLLFCDHLNDDCSQSGIHHLRQFIGVLLASFFYASHIPERFAPGRFDFVGHSHNLLHLFGVAATHEQLRGALIDIAERRQFLESSQWGSSPLWVTVVSPAILIANIAIIILYTRRLKMRENLISKMD